MIGIYAIVNKVNNKMYIGQSNNIKDRFRRHINELKNHNHYNSHLQNAWNKYGKDNFSFIIIEKLSSKNELNNREPYWINYYDTTNRKKGYNKNSGGNNGIPTPESVKKRANKIRGIPRPESVKLKISHTKKQNYKYENNVWVGRNHSQRTKEKISKTKKSQNKEMPAYLLQKLKKINTGRIHTQESIRKIKYAQYKLTDEQVLEIMDRLKNESINKVKKDYPVSYQTIRRIKFGETYEHLTRKANQ